MGHEFRAYAGRTLGPVRRPARVGPRCGATVSVAEHLKDGPRLTREREHFGNDTRLIMSASKEYTLFFGRRQPFPMQGSLRECGHDSNA